MKKKILLVIFICLFIITGCGTEVEKVIKQDSENLEMQPNTRVGYLNFFAPLDYTYRSDLRGYAYREDEKKVYIKGDYENDPDNVISLIVYVTNVNKGAKQYTDEINNKLSDEDVKYSIKSNSKIIEIYSRENYIINNSINYAFIMDKAGYVHVVNIRGPKDEADEITKLVNNVYSSLNFD